MRRTTMLLIAVTMGCTDYDLRSHTVGDNPRDDETDTPVITGPQPDIEVDPPTLDFGYLPKDCPSDPTDVRVTNVGQLPLEVDSIELRGENSGAFSLFATPQTLQPEEWFEFTVTFTPDLWMEYEVDVRIESNDPDEGELDVPLLGVGAEDMVYEDRFTQASPTAVDVLWVIDNSGSMSGDVEDLGLEIPTFINNFVTLDLDWQMAVITTDLETDGGQLQGAGIITPSSLPSPQQAFIDAIDQGSGGSASEKGMDTSYAALESPGYAESAGLVREDGNLAVIIITDEDDSSSMRKTDYVSWLDAYKGDPTLTSFSSMAGPESGGFPSIDCDVMATPIYKYITDETDGHYTDICDMNFTEVLTYLSFTAAGMMTKFPLTYTPSNIGLINVVVDTDVIPYGPYGWTYESASNSVVFHADQVPDPEAEIVITYPATTDCF